MWNPVTVLRVCPDCGVEKHVEGYEGDEPVQYVRCAPCKAVARFEEQKTPCKNCAGPVEADGSECRKCDAFYCVDCLSWTGMGRACPDCNEYLDAIGDEIMDGFMMDSFDRDGYLDELEADQRELSGRYYDPPSF